MRVTIKDVARECGVSIAAVSLALSGKPGRVSAETAERIRQTARQMNYYPNSAAAGLASRRSKTVGLVLSDIRNSHIAELYMAMNQVLQQNGYSPVCHILDDRQPERYEDLLQQIATENLCALVWAKPYEPDLEEENRRLYEVVDCLDIPVLAMDNFAFQSSGINVCFDYEKAGYIATRYLIETGHKRIGCIAGNREFQVTRERLAGYRKALEEAGLSVDPKLIFEGDYTMDSGSRALSYLMGQRVTAIFAQNDEMAFGVYRSARNYGLRIPEELSLIGCDNVPFDDVLEVPLSTVGVPAEEMGRFIGEKVCEALKKKENAGGGSLPCKTKGAGEAEASEGAGEAEISEEVDEAEGSAEADEADSWPGQRRQTVYYEPNLYLRGSVMRTVM